jgi:hypothetical protein
MPTKPTARRRRLRTCPGADRGVPVACSTTTRFGCWHHLVAGSLCMGDLSDAEKVRENQLRRAAGDLR